MDDRVIIGQRIRQARRQASLTQADLAAAIGVSRSHITHAENGDDSLAIDKLAAIAQETRTSLSLLVGEESPWARDPDQIDLNVIYEALDDERRQALLAVARGLAPKDPPTTGCVTPFPTKRRAVR